MATSPLLSDWLCIDCCKARDVFSEKMSVYTWLSINLSCHLSPLYLRIKYRTKLGIVLSLRICHFATDTYTHHHVKIIRNTTDPWRSQRWPQPRSGLGVAHSLICPSHTHTDIWPCLCISGSILRGTSGWVWTKWIGDLVDRVNSPRCHVMFRSVTSGKAARNFQA